MQENADEDNDVLIDIDNSTIAHQEEPPQEFTINSSAKEQTINSVTKENITTNQPQAHLSLLGTLTLIIAFILPIIAYVNHTPKSDAFIQVAKYDEVPIFVPVNHPNIDKWQPLIEQCTVFYNSKHVDTLKPIEVIATSGQPNQITLNYIHNEEHSDQSISVRLLIDQKEVDKVCG